MTEQPPGWTSPEPPARPDAPAAPGGPPAAADAPPPDGPLGDAPGYGSAPYGAPAYGSAPYGAPAYGDRAARPLVPFRPLGLGELLDGGVAVLRRHPAPVFAAGGVVALVGAVLQGLTTLLIRGALGDAAQRASEGSTDGVASLLGTTAVAAGANALVGVITGALLTGIVTAVVGRAVFGETTTVRQAWETLRPRLGSLLLVSLVLALAAYGVFFLALGVVLLVVAVAGPVGAVLGVLLVPLGAALAVLLYVRWSLAPAVVVLEKQTVRAALARSRLLARQSFWRIFGILVLTALITVFIGLVIALPLQLIGLESIHLSATPETLSTAKVVQAAIVSALVATLVGPFAAAVRALLYVDRRIRAEGLDVALVAAAASRAG